MAVATFNSLRGEKSALLMVKRNPLERGGHPAYVNREGANHFAKKKLTDDDKGFEFSIPDGYTFQDMSNEDGEPLSTKDGAILQELVYN